MNNRPVFKGITFTKIIVAIGILISSYIYVFVDPHVEEQFRSDLQKNPSETLKQLFSPNLLLPLPQSSDNNLFRNTQAINGFWFAMPNNWNYHVHDYGKNDKYPDDYKSQLSERIYSRKLTYQYPTRLINFMWITSTPFIKKTLHNPEQMGPYCASVEADYSEEYGKPYKFDECKLVDNINVGFDHFYTAGLNHLRPDEMFFQYSFFLDNRLILLNAACITAKSNQCKVMKGSLDILAQSLCLGSECAKKQIIADREYVEALHQSSEIISDELEWTGIGVEISEQNNFIMVTRIVDNKGAFKAGMQAGDLIVEADKKSFKGISLTDAAKVLRGVPGSSVTVSVLRGNKNNAITFNIIRDKVKDTQYKMISDSTQKLSYSIPENCGVEHVQSSIYDGYSKETKEDESKLSFGSMKDTLNSVKENETGLIDRITCLIDEQYVMWNINSQKTDIDINPSMNKIICDIQEEMLTTMGKNIRINKCFVPEKLYLDDFVHYSETSDVGLYTKYGYMFVHEGLVYNVYGHCYDNTANCNKVSKITDDIMNSFIAVSN